jgi:NarL family two-component system response regulator LiaR
MTLRAVVVGNAEPFRDGLVTLLLELEDKVEVVGWAQDQEEAVQLATLVFPDVALVWAETEPLGGVQATREILEANPSCRVVVFGERADAEAIELAWSAGAAGYVTLDAFSIDLLALALTAEETRLSARASFPAVALP